MAATAAAVVVVTVVVGTISQDKASGSRYSNHLTCLFLPPSLLFILLLILGPAPHRCPDGGKSVANQAYKRAICCNREWIRDGWRSGDVAVGRWCDSSSGIAIV